jgi:regulator of protease activity HflC (stomatin/prohibitin superfamily)
MWQLYFYLGVIILVILSLSVRVIREYERGVKFTLGKYSKTSGPGLRFVFPIIQRMEKIDMRINVVDVPHQDCITKDNISVKVNAVLYFNVKSAEHALIQVQNFEYAVSQLAQTTMRNVVGEVTLDELLSNRDEISKKIEEIVDTATNPWGLDVSSVDLKDISLPEQMRRSIAKEAESERERRALIIASDGEKVASQNLMKAAQILGSSTGALHLRTLQDLSDISSDPSNTIVFGVPIEGINALEGFKK